MTDVTDRKYKRALQANFNRDDSCINYDEPEKAHPFFGHNFCD